MNNIQGDELDTSAHLNDEQVEEALDGVTIENGTLAQEDDTEEGQN